MTKKAAQDEAKKEAILEIFEFLSTLEGQDLMIEGGVGEINLLKESNLTDDPFYDEVRETFKQGRVITRFNFAGKSGAVESYLHGTRQGSSMRQGETVESVYDERGILFI